MNVWHSVVNRKSRWGHRTQYLVHHSWISASLHNPKVTAPLFTGKLKNSLDPQLNGCSGRNSVVQMCSARHHNGLKCILNLIVCNCTPSCLMHSKRMSFWMKNGMVQYAAKCWQGVSGSRDKICA